MTGFGAADVALPNGRVVAEIRSVNGRALDVRVKLPEALGDHGLWAEQLVRKHVLRGRVEAFVRTEGSSQVPVDIDRVRAESALTALRELRDAVDPGAALSLEILAHVPGLFVPRAESVDALRGAAEAALEKALSALDAEKEREGDATLADLSARLVAVVEAHRRVSTRAAELPEVFRKRLASRIAKADVSVEPARLAAEIALVAERSDVSEELARLSAHLERFTTIVDAARRRAHDASERGGRSGRELDFLLQEMLREVGTLGAKAQDHEVSVDVIRMKVELERMREQVQNVE